jgi:hypothetical protein
MARPTPARGVTSPILDRAARKVDASIAFKAAVDGAYETRRDAADDCGIPEQHLNDFANPKLDRSAHLHDARALRRDARVSLAEWLLGPGAVCTVIEADGAAGDLDHALEVQRECAEVTSAHLAALRSGTMTASQARALRKEIREAMRALALLDAKAAEAEREGVVSLHRVGGSR